MVSASKHLQNTCDRPAGSKQQEALLSQSQPNEDLFRATLMLDVAGRPGVVVAATIVAPRDPHACKSVIFAFPGGGYGRHYYDIRHAALPGDTEAEYHARRNTIFVSFDPYGGGDGSLLDAADCTLATTVAVFDTLSRTMVDQLRAGTLVDGLPPVSIQKSIGVGHSLGGMQLIAQQGRHLTYDAVAVLGFSAIHTVVPTPEGMLAPHASDEQAGSLAEAWSGPFTEEMSNLRYAYHWENVDPGLVIEDMTVGFPVRRDGELPSWTTRTFPPFAKICLQEGVVAEDAAKITVPVFVSAGERDVMNGIRPESMAYAAAEDITIYEIKECAHMHNFSPRREALWGRMQDWVDFVTK